MASSSATNPDTLVTLKINIEGVNKRFKLPLRDLGASTLPDKLRYLLSIPPTSDAIFERFSDSAASFVVLDPNNTSVYKQLYRAAKAKLKLRLKVTVIDKEDMASKAATVEDEEQSSFPAYEEPAAPVSPEPVPAPEPTTFAEYANYDKVPTAAALEGLQRRFDELLISVEGKTASKASASSSADTMHEETPLPPRPMDPRERAIQGVVPRIVYGAAECKAFSAAMATHPKRPDPHAAAAQTLAQADHVVPENVVKARAPSTPAVFTVYCNKCSNAIPNEHWHCSTCDDGDYDLCQTCVTNGVVCGGEGHWLIRRFVFNGTVINSTTQTMATKPKTCPPAFASKTTLVEPEESKVAVTRTCNCCVNEMTEDNFVTCLDCEDYDLCIPCHVDNTHGHFPKHAFAPVADEKMDAVANTLLAPGRNVAHNAICDSCEQYIYGVRHKCLDCPDWDYCGDCAPNAHHTHPGHRFVPVYEPLNDLISLSRAYASRARHVGIFCDGPLCNTGTSVPTYIKGDRYKCAVCHDTDFCASCEASPSNRHNKTHPLIKFKTPVRNVSVTTIGDHINGLPMAIMGDRHAQAASKAAATTQTKSANAATQVQTVADLKPTEVKAEVPATKVEVPEAKVETPEIKTEPKELPAAAVKEELVAIFVRDAVADGTVLPPNHVFEQTWYLRNGGKTAWPAGCSVKFVGGDNMCAVDPFRPTSVHELVSAAESTTCYTEVAPGQEAGFTVLMRTPNKAGNFISYWRLTGPDGNKFGHRLWCDVSVAEKKEEAAPVVKEEAAPTPAKEVKQEESSQMIFPKLDKESPATSVHQEVAAPVVPTLNDRTIDEFEDEADEFVDEPLDDDESDDGFLTDEEYDILDASDEEYLAQQGKGLLRK